MYNDKHLSYSAADALWMFGRATTLSIPMLAGSTLATCWRRPNLEYPLGALELDEACVLVNGSVQFVKVLQIPYDHCAALFLMAPCHLQLTGNLGARQGFGGNGWHAMEGVQSLVERRKGAETGVARVRYLAGLEVWESWGTGGCCFDAPKCSRRARRRDWEV